MAATNLLSAPEEQTLSGVEVAERDETRDPADNEATVSTNIADPQLIGQLVCPPRDVLNMLERHGTSLPWYLDTQRARNAQQARENWPLLRGTHPDKQAA